MTPPRPTIRRALARCAVLLAGGLAVSLHPGAASAMLTTCRTDPIVVMSNGQLVDITLSVSASLSQVQHVTYVLHGPAGATPAAVVYPDGTAALSSFSYVGDAPPHTYVVDTTLQAATPRVPMSATINVVQVRDQSVFAGNPAVGDSGSTLEASVTFSPAASPDVIHHGHGGEAHS